MPAPTVESILQQMQAALNESESTDFGGLPAARLRGLVGTLEALLEKRQLALSEAIRDAGGQGFLAETIVNNAKVFETYLLGGA